MSLFDFMGISFSISGNCSNCSDDLGATPRQGSSFLHMLPMLIIFIVVFYFLLVRPQTKRAKEQKKLLE